MTVRHLADARRFVATRSGGGPGGVLRYDVPGPGLLDFQYVEVPVALRGRGVAAQIVKAACDYARGTGARVIPTCPYIAWWFRQQPEEQDLLYRPEPPP